MSMHLNVKLFNGAIAAVALLALSACGISPAQQTPPTFVIELTAVPTLVLTSTMAPTPTSPESLATATKAATATQLATATTEAGISLDEMATVFATQMAAASHTAIAAGTARPTKTPVPLDGDGYLWWINDPTQSVLVTGPSHQQIAANQATADQWAAQGEACLAEPASTYRLDSSIPAPANAAGITVGSGHCTGFQGWVFVAALHPTAP
jgi:hypothetical protein